MPTHTLLFPLVNGVTGVVFFSLAAIAWIRAPQSRFLRLWVVYCFLFAAYTWSVVAAGGLAPTREWADTLIRVAMTVASTSFLILYYFGLTYSGARPVKFHIAHIFVPWWTFLQGLFWFSNLIQADVSTTNYVSKWAPIAGPAMPFYLLFILLTHFLPVFLVIKRYRHERGQDRIQAAYMLVALSIGGIATIGSLLPSIVISRSVLYWIPALMLPFYPLTITYAIIRHRLLDVRTVIHKTLAYGATLIILGFAIYFAMRTGGRFLATLPADEFTVILLGLFLSIYSFARLIKPRVDHFFQRGYYNPAAAVESFAKRSVGVVDRNAYVLLLQETLDQTIYPEHMTLLARTQISDSWMLLPNPNIENNLTLQHGQFLPRLARHPEAIATKQLRDDQKFQEVRTEGEAFMTELQAQVIVPLVQSDQIIAVIALGERRNLRGYTRTDLEFLDRLAAEASKGLINANLYTEVDQQRRALQDLTSTLEERVKNRTFELEHANESLRLLDRYKTNFFANISHEFRTPLTLILGQIESVIPMITQEVTQNKLRMAFRNAQQLLRLINQLLDLSKIEAGSMALKARRANLISFLKNLVYSFESIAERKHILLEIHSTHEEVEIHFDPEKLEKVFYNLLSNAFKFTPECGKVCVRLAVCNEHSPSKLRPTEHWVLISFRDTGIGIPTEELPRIFDRFYQVDGTHTREHEGTGIGLALAMELTKLHRGEITVTSEVGVGTEFVVKLPLDAHHLNASEIFEGTGPLIAESDYLTRPSDEFFPSPMAPSALAPSTATDLILIVEDNADVRSYVRDHLEQQYKIIEAANGEEGMTKAQEAIPDLIVTDVMMPKMDGFAFCRRLRNDEKTSHIPIIMLTAKAALDNKVEGLEAGVDDYLTKPFSPRELLGRVQNLITLRRQLRERFSREIILKPHDIAITPMDEVFLNKVKAVVESHLGEDGFEMEDLGREVGMSRSQIHRKLRALTNHSASHFIRSMRLQRAVELLKANSGTVAEIAYQVGFGSQAYFTKCFHDQFGCSPKEYVKHSL